MKNKLFAQMTGMMLLAVCAAGQVNAFELGDIEIHGFISQGYLLTDHNNYMAETEDGTFQFNETGISFGTELTDQIRVSLQVFSRDLGNSGNNDVVLGYAYGDFRWQNWLGIRAGKIKIDYGLYNETREMDMLRTGVMLPQSVYPEVWRDSVSNLNGAGLYGYAPAGGAGKFSYNVQIGAMEFDANKGFARSLSPRLEDTLTLTDMESNYACFASLQWEAPLPGLKMKGSYYRIEGLEAEGDMTGSTPEGTAVSMHAAYDFSDKYGYIISGEYTWKNLVLSAEYSEDSFKFDTEFTGEMQMGPKRGMDITSQGWYVSAAYRFTDWFESALTYSEYYPDKDDKDGERKPPEMDFSSWLKTVTLSTRFDINENWICKLEGSYNDGFGGVNLADNMELEPYWWLFAAKVTFSF